MADGILKKKVYRVTAFDFSADDEVPYAMKRWTMNCNLASKKSARTSFPPRSCSAASSWKAPLAQKRKPDFSKNGSGADRNSPPLPLPYSGR